MKRVLPAVLLFFLSGIYAGYNLFDIISAYLFFAAAALVCFALFIYHKQAFIFLFAAFAMAGFFYVRLRMGMPDISLDKVRVIRTQGTGYIVSAIPKGVKVLLYGLKDAAPGDIINLTGDIETLQGPRNPGGFNEAMYYAARGVKYKMYAKSAVITGRVRDLSSVLFTVRDELAAIYEYCLPAKEAGVIKSIIVGDRSGLIEDISDLYSKGGIYHVLAISGLHISVLGLSLNSILRIFISRRKAAAATMLPLVLYCFMTGASASTVRAVITVCVLNFACIIFRRSDPLNSLSFAALSLLIYNPFFLWDIGFILSFTAVAGLILLSPPVGTLLLLIGARFPVLKKVFDNFWVKPVITGSIAVCAATAAACTSFLTHVPIYAVIINIIILPTFFALTIIGFLMGVCGLIYLPAAVFLAGPVYFLLNIYEIILKFFTGLPFSNVLTGYIPLYITVPYYALIAAGAVYLNKLRLGKRPRKRYIYAASIIFISAVSLRVLLPGPLTVTMLDIGQGDCFVIKKDEFTMVIDGGGRANAEIGNNTGTRVLMPYLDYLGVNKVDIAVMTHNDYDHAAGITELQNAGRADMLIASANDSLYGYAALSKGDTFRYKDIIFTCLHPDNKLYDTNEGSLVFKMTYKNVSFLFTGDITAEIEGVLSAENNIQADVLKLPHHGSRFSNSEIFLNAVSPRLAIVSYSKYNNYGLPSLEVTRRLEEKNIRLYETAVSGAVTVTTDGNYIKVKGMTSR